MNQTYKIDNALSNIGLKLRLGKFWQDRYSKLESSFRSELVEFSFDYRGSGMDQNYLRNTGWFDYNFTYRKNGELNEYLVGLNYVNHGSFFPGKLGASIGVDEFEVSGESNRFISFNFNLRLSGIWKYNSVIRYLNSFQISSELHFSDSDTDSLVFGMGVTYDIY